MSQSPSRAVPLDVLLVGAGFSGMYMLHKARGLGLNALAIDAAPSVGGTWWHNRYPGARVDIQSMEYSFGFDEALQQDWHWSERYASQPELLRYANHVADRFDLRRDIRLNTRLTSAVFDEATERWQATTQDGRTWSARFLVMASGGLSAPNTPAFEGLETFAGPVFHTANWPHEAVDFSGLSVGVIGTGSSGVQVIPPIAKQARDVTVFQRTAAYVVPAHNELLDPAFEARIKGDYAGFRARNRACRTALGSETPPRMVSALAASPQEREAAFEERWRSGGFAFLGAFQDLMTDDAANALAAEFVRSKIRGTVNDPATARLLCPRHPIGCKRLCVDSAGYYETFNQPNVHLVDIGEQPIDMITPTGLRMQDREFRFDALVLATGFDAMTGTLMRLDLRGRGGLTIQQKWRHGPLNHLGLMVAGFPNLFNVAGVGSPAALTNVMVSIEHHVDWIADCIYWLDANGHCTIEPTEASEAAWIEHLDAMAQRTVFTGCNSWYLGANIPGKPRMFMSLVSGFPGYVKQCAQVANSGYPGFRCGLSG